MNHTKDIIVNKYLLLNIIGNGKFGTIYKGKNIRNNEFVAIKTESPEQTLKHETKMLNYLYSNNCRDIPPVYWYGVFKAQNCLIIPLYDQSLEDYRKNNSDMFSILSQKLEENNNKSKNTKEISITIVMNKLNKIMMKCISIIENIHYYYVLHRDIKPQNFMICNNNIFLIDFGLSIFFMNENGEHIECSEKQCIIGSSNYISPNIHMGYTPSRRDDLISIGYIYMYLLTGSLPWYNITINEKENSFDYSEINILHPKNKKKYEVKKWNEIENVLKNYNENIYKYMNYCYNLEYDSLPNYKILISLFDE